MSTSVVITTFFLLLAMAASTFCRQQPNPIQVALERVLQNTNWVQSSIKLHELGSDDISNDGDVALRDCAQLYDESAARLMVLLSNNESYSGDDARTWLSGVLANQRTCLDGLDEKGFNKTDEHRVVAENLTMVLGEALAFYGKGMHKGRSKYHQINIFGNDNHFLMEAYNILKTKVKLSSFNVFLTCNVT